MTVTGVVLITLVALVALLAIKMPVALSLAVSGALGLTLLKGFGYATNVLGSSPFSTTSSFSLTIVPMFILMGMFAVKANIAEHVFAIANRFVHKAPGGLGVATVMACAGFAAVSGSSIGTAATMSKLSVNEMRSHGYPASMAAAIVAVAGTLGVMIPPSTFLVLYAIMTNLSVAQMLAAGIIPGLISAASYVAYIMIAGHKKIGKSQDHEDLTAFVAEKHAEAKANASGSSRAQTATLTRDEPSALMNDVPLRSLPWRGVIRVAILFIVVLGGMYSGIFTSTESAAIGALVALLMLVLENRKQGTKNIFGKFKEALLDTGSTTSMVFFIIVGSAILSTFFIAARVPDAITDWVAGLPIPPMLTMALLLLCLIPLGMVLESLSILVITVPILFPIAVELGFEGVWLGILIVKLIEIGMVTPPVGINVFVVAGSTGIRSETVFKGILPLFTADMIVTTILFLVPGIVMFLPSLVQSSS